METRKVISLISSVVGLSLIFELLSRHFDSDLFFYIYVGLMLISGALLFYAIFRENNLDDKSETVSNKAALAIFAGVGLMVVLIIFNAVRYK
jgi:hypothetical protein